MSHWLLRLRSAFSAIATASRDLSGTALRALAAAPRALGGVGGVAGRKHREGLTVGLLLSLVFVTILGAVLLRVKRPTSAPIVIQSITPVPTPTVAPTPTPQPIQVYISGAVTRPGVYALPWDSRVQQAIAAAGGATLDADLLRVNLAERVRDEQQVYVPSQNEAVTPTLPTPAPRPTGATGSSEAGQRININTASVDALVALPGIGPTLAQRIVEYRQANGPFSRPEDIKKVKGIGDGIFAEIKDWIAVE
jgi:competence protein ComEA